MHLHSSKPQDMENCLLQLGYDVLAGYSKQPNNAIWSLTLLDSCTNVFNKNWMVHVTSNLDWSRTSRLDKRFGNRTLLQIRNGPVPFPAWFPSCSLLKHHSTTSRKVDSFVHFAGINLDTLNKRATVGTGDVEDRLRTPNSRFDLRSILQEQQGILEKFLSKLFKKHIEFTRT